jgi:hypothetical protein
MLVKLLIDIGALHHIVDDDSRHPERPEYSRYEARERARQYMIGGRQKPDDPDNEKKGPQARSSTPASPFDCS